MEDKDFRKQVQENLEALSFEPTGKVWPEIEYRLKKDKRRRWLIIYWLVAGLITAGGFGSYMYLNKHSNTNDNVVQKPVEKPSSNIDFDKEEGELIKGEVFQPEKNKRFENPVQPEPGMVKATAPELRISVSQPDAYGDADIFDESKPIIKSRSKTKVKTTRQPEPVEETEVKSVGPEPPSQPVSNEVVNTNMKPVEVAPAKSEKADVSPSSATDSTKIKTIIPDAGSKKKSPDLNKKSNPWRFGISLSLGSSKAGDKFRFPGLGSETKNDISVAAGGLGLTVGNPPLPVLTKGFTWGMGLNAEKNLNKTFSFVGGFEYRLLSAAVRTGGLDSAFTFQTNSIGNYYANGDKETYNNRFHNLGISAGINTRLFTKGRISGTLFTGFSANYLLHTNALTYDSSLRRFYQQPNSFNNFQWGINSSLLLIYRFSNNAQLSLGPSFYQSFTPIGKNLMYSDRYFNALNLKLEYYFRRKQ